MMDTPDTTPVEAHVEAGAASAPATGEWGWYLYGVTRADRQSGDGAGELIEEREYAPTRPVVEGDLAAVVRRVPLAEFGEEALRERAGDVAWLERMARRHNEVIEAIHRERTVLPAKFGSVYTSLEGLRAALAEEHDTLLGQLARLDGSDEWGVRLYGDLASIWRWTETQHAGVRHLREDLKAATPGRAYLLRKKLADERAGAADQMLDELVERAYGQLARRAVAGQITRRISGARAGQQEGEAEILRAAFLVPRAAVEAFLDDLGAVAKSQPGLRCQYSGPWPPYSFAVRAGEEPT
ncbi:MAG TPA: GvpL/GvpF family gas vesicle protein [Ktedonobacterales bacterium]